MSKVLCHACGVGLEKHYKDSVYCIECYTHWHTPKISKVKMIEVEEKRYEQLLNAEEKLEQLEANGVDNWEGNGCMCVENMEDECVFCREED